MQRLQSSIFAFCMAAISVTTAAQSSTQILTADRMLDVRSGRLVNKPSILIRHGRIVEVASIGSSVNAPADGKRIDVTGMTLLPGLIDMHVHLDSDPLYGGYTSLQLGDRFWSMLMVPQAEKTFIYTMATTRRSSPSWCVTA